MLYPDNDRYVVHQVRMARRRLLEAREKFEEQLPGFTEQHLRDAEREYRETLEWAKQSPIASSTREQIDEFRDEDTPGQDLSKDPGWSTAGG